MAKKSDSRCWPGYEPVPGKPRRAQGSCRPKAESKLTPSESQFRANREKQLEAWQKEHPGTSKSAAQHLHAPGTEKETSRGKKASTKKAGAKKAPSKKVTAKKAVSKKADAKKAEAKGAGAKS